MPHDITIVEADLDQPEHHQAVVALIDAYAQDPMGQGHPLDPQVKRDLVPGLRALPTTIIFLAYHDGRPAGIAVCFKGFSTFNARPLVNIHDLAVLLDYRGEGIGRRLLAVVEKKAHALSCCKITLEVQENNRRARQVYAAAGFMQAEYVPAAGRSLFLVKNID